MLTLAVSVFGYVSFAQTDDDLTPEEKAYRDSIANLNETNAAIEKSQTAYNAGIELFKQNKIKI